MDNKKYYISTPIYYPSGKWHIGTCYTTVICDAIARFKRMQGYDTFYLTGTDEHGKKLQKKAEEYNMQPKEFIDGQVDSLKRLWKLLNISYDKFIRTTDEEHKNAVSKIFDKLYKQGDIYKSSYEGWYCVPCESFWTKTQLKDDKCPDCGREVELTQEESYFFRLSKYQDRLIKLIEDNPEFLQPKSRQNEMLNNFLKAGLSDLAVSRTTFDWGIKVPFDDKHIIYVWVDALSNYITALGYMSEDESLFNRFWPCDLHMMGKEIVRFHSIIWPAMLMALDVPLPKQIYGHGWLLFGNDKISKSKGNIVDPFILSERYTVDALRYFLLREVPFGNDGAFSNYAFLNRINTDLCNDLGNLLSRTTAMISQYYGGVIPSPNIKEAIDEELINMADSLYKEVDGYVEKLLVPEALSAIIKLAIRCNKYIDETTPWILAKSEQGRERLKTVLYNLAQCLKIIGVMLKPFLIDTSEKILDNLGISGDSVTSFDFACFGNDISGLKVTKGEHLFKRYDIDKELKEMDKIAEELTVKENSAINAINGVDNKQNKTQSDSNEDKANAITYKEINIEEFKSVEMRVARVLECDKAPKSDKLLVFKLEVGSEIRTVVSGIAAYYEPQDLIGKNLILVANLKPVKLRGILSCGMLLCAENDKGELTLLTTDKDIESGSIVC